MATSRVPVLAAALCLTAAAALPAGQRDGSLPTPGSDPPVYFDNVASAAGLDFQHVNGATPERHLHEIMGSGALFFDYDDDGWVDIFLVDGGSLTDRTVAGRARHRLYRNRGNGTFEDVTPSSGITHRAYGMGTCSADYDNDGWVDLYVTNVGPNVLYRNTGGKSFTDRTKAARVDAGAVFSASCAFTDIDRDGDVDLFVTNYVDARVDNNIFCGEPARGFRIYCHPLTFAPLRSVLYRNNGNGTFTDISRESGIFDHTGNGLGIVVGDYNDDGWPDLFVANDSTPNFLYRNEGGRGFKEVALLAGVAVASDGMPRAGMGTDFGDYDGDGRLDLIVTNHELEAHTLFRNLGQGLFEDVSFKSGVGPATVPFVGFGTVFVDHDNDADLDLAIVNGHVMNSPGHVRPGATEAQRKLLLRNEGGGRMKEVGRVSGPGFAVEKVGRALVTGDVDNDGDLDFLVTNNGAAVDLLRNDGAGKASALLLRVVGNRSNKSGVGARVSLTAGKRTQVREVKAGSSYLGQHDLRLHFGLGSTTRIDRIEIRWPAGTTEVVENVPVNHLVTVVEGKGMTERVLLTGR